MFFLENLNLVSVKCQIDNRNPSQVCCAWSFSSEPGSQKICDRSNDVRICFLREGNSYLIHLFQEELELIDKSALIQFFPDASPEMQNALTHVF